MTSRDIKIRDLRRKEKFVVDDEYLNGYARLCGWNATLVYMSLCRHADKDQFSFPSIKKMAEQHSVSRDSIMKGISKLEEYGIIIVSKKDRTDGGKWLCNGYTLVDKTEWKDKPSRSQQHGNASDQVVLSNIPSRSQQHDQVAHNDTKETHRKETHITSNHSKNDGWDFQEKLRQMSENKSQHMRLIAFFFKRKKISFDSSGELSAAIKRHLRASKDLEAFSKRKIVDGMKLAEELYPDKWTLETVLKLLTK